MSQAINSSSGYSSLDLLSLQSRPRPASVLLEIAAPVLYLLLRDQSNGRCRTQELEYVMETWYVSQPKTEISSVQNYPTYFFPDSCFNCGVSTLCTGSILRSTCRACQAKPNRTAEFFASWVEHGYKINQEVIKASISTAIWNLQQQRNLQNVRSSKSIDRSPDLATLVFFTSEPPQMSQEISTPEVRISPGTDQ